MGARAKAPPKNAALEKKQETLLNLQIQQAKNFKPLELPEAPKTLPTPPPPQPDLAAIQELARVKMARKYAPGRNTLLAGETGGFNPSATQAPSLLAV